MVDVALFPFWQRFLWIGSHYRGVFHHHRRRFFECQVWRCQRMRTLSACSAGGTPPEALLQGLPAA